MFQGFLIWLYDYDPTAPDSYHWLAKYERNMVGLAEDEFLGCITELMVFADFYDIPKLTANLTKAAVMYCNNMPKFSQIPTPSYETIVQAFKLLQDDHAFLEVLVDVASRYWSPACYSVPVGGDQKWFKELPKEFLFRQLRYFSSLPFERRSLSVGKYGMGDRNWSTGATWKSELHDDDEERFQDAPLDS